MNEIYWLTRLGALHDFLLVCCVVFGLLTLSFGIFYFMEERDFHRDEECIKKSKKLFIKSIIGFLIVIIGVTFIPSREECLFIYGLGGTIDYIKSNDEAKKLPDKVINALDKYLEEQSKERI